MEMDSSRGLLRPEKLREKQNEVVMGLVKGKEYASQLQALLAQKPIDGRDEGCLLAKELAQKVLRSFTDSIAQLSLCRPSPHQIAADDDHANNYGSSSSTGDDLKFLQGFFDEGTNKKRRPAAEAAKDRRGCYKRRREAESWVVVSPTMEDGYAWRKYGQKEILNSKHPRCYFRCTHKYDQDLHCGALKQVQKVEDGEKLVYQTTYFGQHTCKDHSKAPLIIVSDSEEFLEEPSSNLISFRGGGKLIKSSQQQPSAAVAPAAVKQESKGETTTSQSDLTDLSSSIDSSNNTIMWQDHHQQNLVCSPMASAFHDQEVASSSGGFLGDDASIKSLIDPFSFDEEDGFLLY